MIDTHCHVDFYPIPERVAQEVEDRGILTIAVTNLPSHFAQSRPHVLRFKRIRLALGLHPLLVESHTECEQRKFEQLLDMTSYIGEVGLDFSRDGKLTMEQQIETLRFVLELIRDRPRFVTIHARKAEERVLQLLQEYEIAPAVFHWYSGTLTTLDKIMDAGHYVSVNPAMVLSKKGRQIVGRIQRNRLLTETDGPYVLIKGRPAHPSDVRLVLDYLGEQWRCPFDEVDDQVSANFTRILTPVRLSYLDGRMQDGV